jgi:hypothetical protein
MCANALDTTRSSSVSTVTGRRVQAGPPGLKFRHGLCESFLFATAFRPALEPTDPPVQWELGALSPRVKRPEREDDHSPTTCAEIKKVWIYTFIPPIRLHDVVLS